MKHTFVAVLILLATALARAETAPEPQPSPTPTPQPDSRVMELTLLGGATLRPQSDYLTRLPGSHSTWVVNDKASYYLGGELLRRLRENLAVGGQILWSEYRYNEDITSDKHIGLLATGRLQRVLDSQFRLWGSLGLGFLFTKVGQTKTIDGTANASANSDFHLGWAFSPRVGLDYLIGPFFMGVEASFLGGSFQSKGTNTDRATGAMTDFTKSYARFWYAIGARMGILF